MIVREVNERSAKPWLVISGSPLSENAISIAFGLSVNSFSCFSCWDTGPETHSSGGFKDLLKLW